MSSNDEGLDKIESGLVERARKVDESNRPANAGERLREIGGVADSGKRNRPVLSGLKNLFTGTIALSILGAILLYFQANKRVDKAVEKLDELYAKIAVATERTRQIEKELSQAE